MKIIREGNLALLLRNIVFLCLHCGCEFEAIRGEYKEDQRDGPYCQCPCCGNYTSKILRECPEVRR